MLEFELPTEEEIYHEIKTCDDFFGVSLNDLLPFLSFTLAREFLKPEVIAVEWDEDRPPLDRKAIIDKILDYLPFAFKKAESERGLSTMRSVSHLKAWLFLLGDTEAVEFASSNRNYEPYGLPILEYVNHRYCKPLTQETYHDKHHNSTHHYSKT